MKLHRETLSACWLLECALWISIARFLSFDLGRISFKFKCFVLEQAMECVCAKCVKSCFTWKLKEKSTKPWKSYLLSNIICYQSLKEKKSTANIGYLTFLIYLSFSYYRSSQGLQHISGWHSVVLWDGGSPCCVQVAGAIHMCNVKVFPGKRKRNNVALCSTWLFLFLYPTGEGYMLKHCKLSINVVDTSFSYDPRWIKVTRFDTVSDFCLTVLMLSWEIGMGS